MEELPEWPRDGSKDRQVEKVAVADFWHMKTKSELQIFCHRDPFQLDWYFLLGYSFLCREIAERDEASAIFPGFHT